MMCMQHTYMIKYCLDSSKALHLSLALIYKRTQILQCHHRQVPAASNISLANAKAQQDWPAINVLIYLELTQDLGAELLGLAQLQLQSAAVRCRPPPPTAQPPTAGRVCRRALAALLSSNDALDV